MNLGNPGSPRPPGRGPAVARAGVVPPYPERTPYMAHARGLGAALLGIWLLLHGLVQIIGLSFAGLPVILGLLALVSGILILLGK